MGTQSLIFVGAGIAGLSTGFYARLNGMRTTIFETHKVPGGLCAAWKRKGYTFDSSMQMLVGSKPPDGELIRVVARSKSLSFRGDPCRMEEQLAGPLGLVESRALDGLLHRDRDRRALGAPAGAADLPPGPPALRLAAGLVR